MKKFDSYKKCVIQTSDCEVFNMFDNSWSFSAIKDWMLDTYSLSLDDIVSIQISSVTIYKVQNDG